MTQAFEIIQLNMKIKFLAFSEYFSSFAEYNRDQYIPAKILNSDYKCLITNVNDLGDGRFYDPRTRQSFK